MQRSTRPRQPTAPPDPLKTPTACSGGPCPKGRISRGAPGNSWSMSPKRSRSTRCPNLPVPITYPRLLRDESLRQNPRSRRPQIHHRGRASQGPGLALAPVARPHQTAPRQINARDQPGAGRNLRIRSPLSAMSGSPSLSPDRPRCPPWARGGGGESPAGSGNEGRRIRRGSR